MLAPAPFLLVNPSSPYVGGLHLISQMSFWIDTDPCDLSTTSLIDLFVDTFFLVMQADLLTVPLHAPSPGPLFILSYVDKDVVVK